MSATSVKGAAEIAADYLYHLFDELGAGEQEGIDHAAELYQLITGEEMDVEGVLGV